LVVILSVSVHVADPPSITSQLQELKDNLQGKCVKLVIQVIGTKPLSYHWQWKPAEEGWQPCNAGWCNGATLTIPNTQKSNEGSYRCVISNSAGNQTSKSAELLSVGKDQCLYATVITINCFSLTHHMHVFYFRIHVVNSPRTTSLSQEQSAGKSSVLMVCISDITHMFPFYM